MTLWVQNRVSGQVGEEEEDKKRSWVLVIWRFVIPPPASDHGKFSLLSRFQPTAIHPLLSHANLHQKCLGEAIGLRLIDYHLAQGKHMD